jgi:5'-nucleotidase
VKQPLILLTNDDSINATGLQAAIDMLAPCGELFVIAPDEPRSGSSHALTINTPVKLTSLRQSEGLSVYMASGTPADCVKLATSCLLPRMPDLLVAGINHGSNSSVSVIYSGTMGAAIEGAMLGVPSIGFSLCSHSRDADFAASIKYGRTIARKIIEQGLPPHIALNVNIPALPESEVKGIRICRQNRGYWNEDFAPQLNPLTGENEYWLTGFYHNEEPGAAGTDETALSEGYISIVPVQFDMTAYEVMNEIQGLVVSD